VTETTVPIAQLGDGWRVRPTGPAARVLVPICSEVDDVELLATLHHRGGSGVALIDTANVYGGDDKRLLLKRLADWRNEVTLATRSGIDGNTAVQAGAAARGNSHADLSWVSAACE
jgi:aryl-alcohol dehydrogenase-like predicted oxidoreductase